MRIEREKRRHRLWQSKSNLLERGVIATRTTFLLTNPLLLPAWLQIFQLCLSFWTSSFDMVLLKNFFRKKKNIRKTSQNALAPSIFIVFSIVLKLGTPLVTVPQSDHSHTARCRKTPVGANIVERKRSKEYRKGKELILPWPKKLKQPRARGTGAWSVEHARAYVWLACLFQFFWPG